MYKNEQKNIPGPTAFIGLDRVHAVTVKAPLVHMSLLGDGLIYADGQTYADGPVMPTSTTYLS
jgi:hypothetical protein